MLSMPDEMQKTDWQAASAALLHHGRLQAQDKDAMDT